MQQATNGFNTLSFAEATGTGCSVCGQPLDFKETGKNKDPALDGLAIAEHCDQQHIIFATGYRMAIAPINAPEGAPQPRSKAAEPEVEIEVKKADPKVRKQAKGIFDKLEDQ